jgi:MFS transporter, putative metabolite transport protein
MVVFLTGVALPLIAEEFSLDASEKGFVSAAALAGILVGASGLGGLADHLGAKNSSSWKWGFSLSSSSP